MGGIPNHLHGFHPISMPDEGDALGGSNGTETASEKRRRSGPFPGSYTQEWAFLYAVTAKVKPG